MAKRVVERDHRGAFARIGRGVHFSFIGRPATTNSTSSAAGRDRLVHEAGGVAERSRQRIVGYDAEANFVGDQDDRAALARQRIRQPRDLLRPVALCMQQVGQPERQAINEPGAAAIGRGQRLDEIERHFAFDPVGAAPCAMPGDPLVHLRIERLGGGDIDRLPRKGVGTTFGAPAFPGPRPARDPDHRHIISCATGIRFARKRSNHQSR